MAYHILLVDDDEDICEIAGESLRREGFVVKTSSDADEAREEFTRFEPDLIVLDIMFGTERVGLELCREFRSQRDVPIVFLTARASDIDAVVGLELGADDYVTKPFSPRELAARVRAVLRRLQRADVAPRDGQFEIGPLTVDQSRLRVATPQGEETLTRSEFFILQALARDPGKVWSREDLISEIFSGGEGGEIAPRTVDSHIRHLRDKLRLLGVNPIQTVRGIGYRLASLDS